MRIYPVIVMGKLSGGDLSDWIVKGVWALQARVHVWVRFCVRAWVRFCLRWFD